MALLANPVNLFGSPIPFGVSIAKDAMEPFLMATGNPGPCAPVGVSNAPKLEGNAFRQNDQLSGTINLC